MIISVPAGAIGTDDDDDDPLPSEGRATLSVRLARRVDPSAAGDTEHWSRPGQADCRVGLARDGLRVDGESL